MNHPLRVLHVIPSVSPKRGGPSTAIFSMVRALNESGDVQAEIVTTNDDGPGISSIPIDQCHGLDRVPVRVFPRADLPFRAAREFAYAAGFRKWLARDLRSFDCLHVHALFSYLPTTAMFLARRAGVPYVARPLGLLGAWPLQQSAWRKKIYLAAIEAANLQAAAAVHFTSEAEKEEATCLGLAMRGGVIPHGVDVPELIPDARTRLCRKLGLPSAQKIVLFLGRLHHKKGLDLLLAALQEIDDACLILAGTGEPSFQRELHALVGNLGLAPRLIQLGQVEGQEKQWLLQGADVLALTSRHENFGMVVVEALAAGTPVLVSDQVALAKDVAAFQLGRVVSLDVKAISNALCAMLEDGAQWKPARLRKFAADSYSWKMTARALGELYRSVI